MSNPTLSLTNKWSYENDVFMSFRGEIRKSFIAHLHSKLCGIKEARIFIDTEGLKRGYVIREDLSNAIEKSRIGLVVFSPDYASSTHCLDEVAKIIEISIYSKHQKRMWFYPVFYNVEPSALHKKNEIYDLKLTELEARDGEQKIEKWKINKWRNALKTAAGVSGFTSYNYSSDLKLIDDIVKHISNKINEFYNGDKNQITYNIDDRVRCLTHIHDSFSSQQPKEDTTNVLNKKVEHVSWRSPYNKISTITCSDPTTLNIAFHNATNYNDVVIHKISLPTWSSVGDVINNLKSKVNLSHSDAELRLLGISDHRIKKLFSSHEKIENITNMYETIRAEEIPKEEKDLRAEHKLIHVYHFNKYGKKILNFGDPFFMVIHKNEKLFQIKQRIQKMLQIPYDEISKWNFASVLFDDAEDLKTIKGRDSVFDRFKRGSTYGNWEQYLGLEHANK